MTSTEVKKTDEFRIRAGDIIGITQSGNLIAFETKDEVTVFNFDRANAAIGNIQCRYTSELSEKRLSFSRSGKYLLEKTTSSNKIKVIDLVEGRVLYQHSSSAKVNAAILISNNQKEYLIATLAPYQLTIIDLSTLEPVFTLDSTDSFQQNYVQLEAMPDDDMVAGMGYLSGESLDSLFAFSFSKTIKEKKGLHFIRDLSDYAPVLKIGKSNRKTLLIYRDPEDSETDVDPDEFEAKPLYNFRGLYERDLNTHMIQARIPIELDNTDLRTFFLTDSSIVLGLTDGIKIISRKDVSAEGKWLQALKYTFNAIDESIILIAENDELEIISSI